MLIRVRRQRRLTRRVAVIAAAVAGVGVVAAVIIGRANATDSNSSTGGIGDGTHYCYAGACLGPVKDLFPCDTNDHTVEAAALTAIEGLRALTQANLHPVDPDTEDTLNRYVTAERRPLMRQYLEHYPAPFTKIDSTVLAWQQIAYSDEVAVLRLASVDTATTADGMVKATDTVTDATIALYGEVRLGSRA